MAFSNSSFFAGIGVAFGAIAVGFAGGAMITTSAVQPPNRLERLNSTTTVGSNSAPTHQQAASSATEQSNVTKPPAQDVPSQAVAAAPVAPAADSQTTRQPQPAAAKPELKTDVSANGPQQNAPAPVADNPPPAPVARNDNAAPVKDEHPRARSADSNREATRKKTDGRRFSERRRRLDQDDRRLDDATNVVRQMPRDNRVGEVVEQDDGPRYGRQRHFDEEDDAPRMVGGPAPGFLGLFGN